MREPVEPSERVHGAGKSAPPGRPAADAAWSGADLVEALPEPAALLDARGRIQALNRAWRSFDHELGLAPDETALGGAYVDGLSRLGLFGDTSAEARCAAIDPVRRGERARAAYALPAPTGRGRDWHRMEVSRVGSGGALLLRYVSTTETVLAREHAEESERRLQRVLDTTPQLVLIADAEGVVERTNRRDQWAEDPLIGRSFFDHFPPAEQRIVRRSIRRAMRTGETVRFEVETIPRDGTPRTYAVQCRAVRCNEGPLVLFLADVTAQRQVEEALEQSREQLQQAQKMEAVARLVGGVAHDFNNVLTAIGYFASAVGEEVPEGSQAHEDVIEIEQATRHAADLTRQLLAFGRRQALRPRVLDLNDRVRSVTTLLSRLIGENVRLETDLADEELLIEADPSQLEQILTNLVVNARDAIDRTGTVRIGTRREDDRVVLEVEDDGVGMPEEVRARVFDPFFTTKENGKGTGLGLATVHEIVRRHHAEIAVDSEPGCGTRFVIRFGASADPAEPVDASGRTYCDVRGDGLTILLCEDDERVRRASARPLQARGYRVIDAATVAHAIEIAQREEIHMVLTDGLMPDGEGTQIVDRVRERWPTAAALMMTGYAPEELLKEHPGLPVLRKPFRPSELVDAVRDALDDHRSDPPPPVGR